MRLCVDGECDVTVDRWSALDADQYFLNDEHKVCAESFCDCEQNTVLALEDRNSLANEWPGRSVFVVKGLSCVCIFDEWGEPIDEPSEFVTAGRQPLEGDGAFHVD